MYLLFGSSTVIAVAWMNIGMNIDYVTMLVRWMLI